MSLKDSLDNKEWELLEDDDDEMWSNRNDKDPWDEDDEWDDGDNNSEEDEDEEWDDLDDFDE